MRAHSLDTSTPAHEAQLAAYRRMGATGRTQVVFRLNDLARKAAEAGIRSWSPGPSRAAITAARGARTTSTSSWIRLPRASIGSSSALRRLASTVDADVARDALRRRRQFSAIEMTSASKLDLIIRKDRPFSVEELARRRTVELPGSGAMAIASPEDVVLAKLEWARKAGGSERQLGDVRGIVEVNSAGLDRAYIERWARELGVLDLWQQVSRG